MLHSLPTAILGRTGLQVTRLGYGTAGNKAHESRWKAILPSVLDSGINFIDTANDYGANRSLPAEEMIGKYISDRRSDYFIATKCGCAPSGPHVWTRENAFRGLHESLGRLRTDYVDLMQYHNPSVNEAETGDLVTVLQDMKKQGKVRWLGVSTTLPHISTYIEWNTFDVFQIPYSALEREHEDWIAKAAEAGIGIIIRGGVAQGEPTNDQNESKKNIWQKFYEANLDDLRESGESRTTLILRYTLSHPNADTNIVGTMNSKHLSENVAGIMKGPLNKDTYLELKRRMDSVGINASPVI